jgi:hypothetical protein
MMHHGVVEHWAGQAKLHPYYLVEDYTNIASFLAAWDVRLVFTGHYHAQDIALARFGDKFIYDIETGSLVTAPSPIRFMEISDNTIHLRTDNIIERLHPNTDFAANAHAFVKHTVKLEALETLKKYRVTGRNADLIAEAVGDAFAAHYAGDEDRSLRPPFNASRLGLWSRFIYGQFKYVLDGLWENGPVADNNVSLPL